MSSVHKRKVLEETGGYDESLAYGEDTDFSRRKAERDYRVKRIEAEEYNSFVDSLPKVYRQGRWYGKSILKFLGKYPQASISLVFVMVFASFPFAVVLSLFSKYFIYLAVLEALFITTYVFLGYLDTRNPYMFSVPVVKTVRSISQVIGLVEGFFTEDLGRE